MAKPPPSKVLLWTNVSALMRHHWKQENLNELARKAKVSPATAQRIKDQQTSVGLDVIDKVAGIWGYQAWQLLLVDLDPANVPASMISESQKRLFDRLKRARALMADEHPEKTTVS